MQPKRRFLLLASLGFSLFAGCVLTSLHPAYHEKDIIFEPRLVGTWSTTEDLSKDSWIFEAGETNHYRVTYVNEGKKAHLDGAVFKLGGHLFLDLRPTEEGLKEAPGFDTYAVWLIATHIQLRLAFREDSLTMAAIKLQWLDELLKKNPRALRHERTEDRVIATASTDEIQAFLLKYAGEEEAFEKADELKRRKKGAPRAAVEPAKDK